jgi:hypothetical protein
MNTPVHANIDVVAAVKFFVKCYLVAWCVNEVLQFAYWLAR